jgi:hypothetical protein
MKAVFVILLLAASTATGQIIVDPAGDVTSTILDSEEVQAGPPSVDLLELQVVEHKEFLKFTASVSAFNGLADISMGLWTGFQYQDTEMAVQVSSTQIPVIGANFGNVWARPAGSLEWVMENITQVTIMEGAPAEIRFDVSRNDIKDQVGFHASKGEELTNFWMLASDKITRSQIVEGMPKLHPYVKFDDFADSANTFQLTIGDDERTSVRLHTTEPIRRTNGDAQTLIYNVSVTNFENSEKEIELIVLDAPEDWEVSPLRPYVRLGPGETTSSPVAVSIPFKHTHGKTVTAKIAIQELSSEKKLDTQELGLYFLSTPLPSGHHDTLWLHTLRQDSPDAAGGGRGSITAPYVTTLETDSSDTQAPVRAFSKSLAPVTQFYWCLAVTPAMVIGLDLLQGTAELAVDFRSELDVSGTASGRVVLVGRGLGYEGNSKCAPQPAQELISFQIGNLDLERQVVNQQQVEFPTEATRIAPAIHKMYVELMLEVPETVVPVGYFPTIEPGLRITLPLADYEDEIPAFGGANGVGLEIQGDSRLQRNPGATAVIQFNLEGIGDYELTLFGNNEQWATIPAPKTESGAFAVIVKVPESAVVGDVLELVLQAENEAGFALFQFSIEVAEGNYPNDEIQADGLQVEQRETPFPAGILVLACLVAARKRR